MINAAEFKHAMSVLGAKMKPAELAAVTKSVAKNPAGDGLDYLDFVRLLSSK